MLSGNSMLAFNNATMRYKLKHGTISLIQAMLDDAKPEVQLSTPVKAVEDLGSQVKITTARGQTITAASVIVATPLNVIDNIKFTPALPAAMTQAAQEKHAASNSYKVLIKVKGKVGNLFTMAEAGHAFTTVFTYEEAEDHTLLVGFGDRDLVDVYDDEALQTALRDFIPDVEVESSYSYEWALDPYSKGMHCVYKPGWHQKYHSDFQQDNGRIIIGVGDYVEGWRGFIDGAIGGGIKAAVRVQKLLG
jgi:monoamine oxidase